jgi:CRISPR-associated endonuclease/helicase Cas3
MDDGAAIAALASEAAAEGARVLIIRNTVSSVLAVQEALEAAAPEHVLFAAGGVIAPHHSRYAACDRRLLDAEVERRFGKRSPAGGLVLCASQTCEVSLNIDADLMITDLCPGDVLLQRAGRLHRHERDRPSGFEAPRLVVVTPSSDLTAYLRSGRHGLGSVYEDLTGIEATRRWLEARDAFTVPADNRALVEAATRGADLDALAGELGFEWQTHRRKVIGEANAKRHGADAVSLDWSDPYATLRWTEPDQAVMARLGALDRIVWFEAPVRTPFGQQTTSLSVPAHLADGADPEVEFAEDVVATEGAVSFVFGGITFAYDRMGLKRC